VYCSGNAGLGGISVVGVERETTELLIADEAKSSMLGRLRRASGGCSMLERGVVVDELGFDACVLLAVKAPEADFQDFNMDLRTPLLLSGGGCC